MSMNDDFIEHLFNAFGSLAKASRRADQDRAEARANRGGRGAPTVEGGRKRIKSSAFDEAPSAPSSDSNCCTAKRG